MWTCENDLIKDLASIHIFGSDTMEPLQIVYSAGRGLRKNQNLPQNFIDPRSGEINEIKDINSNMNDICCRSRGRGAGIPHLMKSTYQLQKQLRLVRPQGSGDVPVETYFGRHSPYKTSNEETSLSEKDYFNMTLPLKTEIVTHSSFPDMGGRRIKAVRSSSSHSNALISSLLSKDKANVGEAELGNPVPSCDNNNNCSQDDDDDVFNNSEDNSENDNDISGVVNHGSKNKLKVETTFQTINFKTNRFEGLGGLNCEYTMDLNNDNSSHSSTKDDIVNNNIEEKFLSNANESVHATNFLVRLTDLNSNHYTETETVTKEEHTQNEKYRRLGERLHNKIHKMPLGTGIYDLNPLFKYISPIDNFV